MNNEIPKNPLNIPSSASIVETQSKSNAVLENTLVAENAKEINEIPDNPADRASVKADNLENDMKIFASNPELVKKALDVSEIAEKRYNDSGVSSPAFKGLEVGKAFVEEFQN